jgi:hypothetical protein
MIYWMRKLYSASPSEQVEDENNDCENEQQVNPRTQGWEADETDEPKDDEDYGNCPKHCETSRTAISKIAATSGSLPGVHEVGS